MTLIEIEAKRYHCGQMARRLRTDHARILLASPRSIHRQLSEAFEASIIRRAFILDGELVALVGITGTISDDQGDIWMALGESVSRARPAIVARAALRFMARVSRNRPTLTTDILAKDQKSRLFATFLGFSAGARSVIEGIDTVHMARRARKAA